MGAHLSAFFHHLVPSEKPTSEKTVTVSIGCQRQDEEKLDQFVQKHFLKDKTLSLQGESFTLLVAKDGEQIEVPLKIVYPPLSEAKSTGLTGNQIYERYKFSHVTFSVEQTCVTDEEQSQHLPKPPTDVQILTFKWLDELKKYKRIKICNSSDYKSIWEAIRYTLQSKIDIIKQQEPFEGVQVSEDTKSTYCQAIYGEGDSDEEEVDMNVVVTLKRTRVQSDAESAIEKARITPELKEKTILLIFHKIAGSKTVEDVSSIMYRNDNVLKTFHVPFRKIE